MSRPILIYLYWLFLGVALVCLAEGLRAPKGRAHVVFGLVALLAATWCAHLVP